MPSYARTHQTPGRREEIPGSLRHRSGRTARSLWLPALRVAGRVCLAASVALAAAEPALAQVSVSAPATANLGSGNAGTTVTTALGPVTVTDNRALLSATWILTVASTNATAGGSGATIPSASVSIDPGSVTTTGTITVVGSGLVDLSATRTLLDATSGIGDNTASCVPTLSVNVPPDAVPGDYTLTLTFSTSSVGGSATTVVQFTVNPRLTLAPATLPDGRVGSAYSQQLTAGGGTPPYTFTVAAGALPPGLTLSAGGLLSGTPTASGTFAFDVTANDSGSLVGSQHYVLTVRAAAIPTLSPALLVLMGILLAVVALRNLVSD